MRSEFEQKLAFLSQSIEDLKQNKQSLESTLDEVRTELDQLTRFDKRKVAMQEVEETFEDIASFLEKVHTGKKKTLLAYKKLEALMGAERGDVNLTNNGCS